MEANVGIAIARNTKKPVDTKTLSNYSTTISTELYHNLLTIHTDKYYAKYNGHILLMITEMDTTFRYSIMHKKLCDMLGNIH